MTDRRLAGRQPWSMTDFRINAAFWNHWGSDAAQPFRIQNLTDLLTILDSQGINAYLYGSTLRDCALRGALGPDHDDDICVTDSKALVLDTLLSLEDSHPEGFRLIRWDDLVSVERHGRYIDIHFLPDAPRGVSRKRIHGHDLPLPVDAERVLRVHDENKKAGQASQQRQSAQAIRRGLSELLRVRRPTDLYSLARRVAVRFYIPAQRRPKRPKPLRSLTESEFLGLKIDAPTAVNWDWRGSHWHAVFRPNETFGEALLRLNSGFATTDAVAPDTHRAFDEPMNLSRRFWKSGNNSLMAPLLFGFRHNVVPYLAANLYINRQITPQLYTNEYFESLPLMSDEEIADFLAIHPVTVDAGCLTSGRHRATAMLGRLLRGEPYIPMTYLEEPSK